MYHLVTDERRGKFQLKRLEMDCQGIRGGTIDFSEEEICLYSCLSGWNDGALCLEFLLTLYEDKLVHYATASSSFNALSMWQRRNGERPLCCTSLHSMRQIFTYKSPRTAILQFLLRIGISNSTSTVDTSFNFHLFLLSHRIVGEI